MTFSEKLYSLRKSRGLSQEQLAQELNVSRQAVSKWEARYAVPETEKLLAISKFFGVSMDYLMNDDWDTPSPAPTTPGKQRLLPGILLCAGGAVCMIVWGLLSILLPRLSGQISASSTVQLDGNAIILILCVAAVIAGAVLLLKGSKNN